MTAEIEIQPSGPIRASVRPPSSKSITNRALICAALAEGQTCLRRPLFSDDTKVMIDSLQRLGLTVHQDEDQLRVDGQAGRVPQRAAEMFIGNSGTSVRFLTAMVSVLDGQFTLDGIPRMRQRPIQDLVDALNQLGADVRTLNNDGCPPVVVNAVGLQGGRVTIRGDVSSQYLSGLLMAAPYAKRDTHIVLDGPLVSRPYVDMTLAIMQQFGVQAQASDAGFEVSGNCVYQPTEFEIEPDASAASYFWAAAAITGGDVLVRDLSPDALQGDVGFCQLLEKMGCTLTIESDGMRIQGPERLRGIDCDMADVSDTAQTLSAVALLAEGPTRIRGVAHNRHKETDRIGNLAIELRKFGATVLEFDDGLEIQPPAQLQPAHIDTYDDHRMAMSLALPGLRFPGVVIRDPGCTAKTYPEFFQDLQAIQTPVA